MARTVISSWFVVLAWAYTGCVEGPTSVAPATQVARPTSWQQFCEQAQDVPQANAWMAARGAEGWELVAMYYGTFCYKRPVVVVGGSRGPGPPRPGGVPGSAGTGTPPGASAKPRAAVPNDDKEVGY